MAKTLKEGKWKETFRDDFAGGVNVYIGQRQIEDNESPESINCDFRGKGGVGNRDGYNEIGSVADSRTTIQGMSKLHTASKHQLIKFADNGSNTAIYYSTDDGAWTGYTTTTWVAGKQIYACQAYDKTYVVNGNNDVMRTWDGSAVADLTANGSKGTFPTFYNKRLWVIDPVTPYRLRYSGMGESGGEEGGATTSKFANFTYHITDNPGAGYLDMVPGSGKDVVGLITFQNTLYVFLTDAIYRIGIGTAANTFTVTLVTSAIGCISGSAIAQVEEDVFFTAEDGVYSLGEVANYTSVRTTNKSRKIQQAFDGITAANKKLIVGRYFNFKYHMFYSLNGTENDSAFVYDIRYKGWQDWRTIYAQHSVIYRDSTGKTGMYTAKKSDGKVFRMHNGYADDNGTAISSSWKSKSFDESLSSIMKLYFDTTFTFGALAGTVTMYTIFDDNQVSAPKSISQERPQGGMGRDHFGLMSFGDATNNQGVITNYAGVPLRLRAKDKKYSIQYKITSNDNWRLDSVSQLYFLFGHFKFNSLYKLN
jgi:hypothetical protein